MTRSERYLRAVASRSRHAKGYGEELARAVLELEVVQLAKDVIQSGAMKYTSAARLAEAILGAAGRSAGTMETVGVQTSEAKSAGAARG